MVNVVANWPVANCTLVVTVKRFFSDINKHLDYSLTQEEFENLCFVAVYGSYVGVCLRHIEMIARDQSFFTNFAFVCSEER